MSNVKHEHLVLESSIDNDDDGLDSTLNNITSYFACDYPVITPRFVKSLNVLLGYLDGTNATDSSKWTSYATSLTDCLRKQYLVDNPDWLWDPFSLETGDTTTEAKRQADEAMTGKVYHSGDAKSHTVPYVILLQNNGQYTANVVESDSAANYASTIVSDMSAKLVSTTTVNDTTTSVLSLV